MRSFEIWYKNPKDLKPLFTLDSVHDGPLKVLVPEYSFTLWFIDNLTTLDSLMYKNHWSYESMKYVSFSDTYSSFKCLDTCKPTYATPIFITEVFFVLLHLRSYSKWLLKWSNVLCITSLLPLCWFLQCTSMLRPCLAVTKSETKRHIAM